MSASRGASLRAAIWRYDRGRYKVYVEDRALKRQIASWQGCYGHCIYFNSRVQVVGWDVIFPSNLYNRVATLCGLPLRQKASQRVAHGRRLGRAATTRNHLGLSQEGGQFSNSQFSPEALQRAIDRPAVSGYPDSQIGLSKATYCLVHDEPTQAATPATPQTRA